MRVLSHLALLASLAATLPVSAQVPRDPLAGGAPPSTKNAAPAQPGNRQTPAPFVTRQTDLEIPFSVRAGTTPETQPTAVRVIVSWDRGKSWHFYEEVRPEAGRFRFRAKQDGEFWFATQTIDRSGKSDSAEPRSPQLRLVIDTQKPQLVVQAQADAGGNVNLAWSAADPALVPQSLKIEYQDAGSTGGNWEALDLRSTANASAQANLSGQVSFHPMGAASAINLRAEVADAAGNMSYYSQRISLAPPPPKAGNLAYSPTPDPSATPWPAQGSAGPTSEQVRIPNLIENSFVGPGRLASASPKPPASGEELPSPSTTASNTSETDSHLPPPAASDPVAAIPPSAGYAQSSSSAAAQPDTRSLPAMRPTEVMPAPRQPEAIDATSGQRPRLTNSRRFSLDYDIQTVGPEGVEAVELWGTTDGGRSWVKWGADPDRASPFDVEVNHEATYGFRIVIVGKNGLATSTPQSGDAADIWVGTDLTRPQARLTGAQYGQGNAAGKLDIRWEASDANLGSRPITLSISDRPDGQFTPIAAGLPNTGQYFWEYDPRSPRQIFLRLEVRDEAANIAIDQLTEPIKVEGLEPKGQIRGFNPGPENVSPGVENRGAFRSPLFR